MSEANTLNIHKKKHDLNAANPYQYSKLQTAQFYFVPCRLEETYDEVIFTYDLTGLSTFAEARKLDCADQCGLLLQLLEAVSAMPEYTFGLSPENLFFDRQRRIRIMERDIGVQAGAQTDILLADLKALTGYLLQKRYTYENLREGGASLLKKNGKTKFLSELPSSAALREALLQLQEEDRDKTRRQMLTVKKSKYRRNLWLMGAAIAGCIGLAAVAYRQNRFVIRPQASALMAERAYMEQDFTGVVDALADIPVAEMDRHEKYLLAVVAIKGQSVDNFDVNTKDRLLSKLSYDGAEYLLDYWIALGRMDVDEALDIAMRMSDHQLTLYAYLQKIDLIAADNQLSGEEKVVQTEAIRGKIKTLADELGIEYKEK